MDSDYRGRLENVFFAVARSIAAYESFRDVITFDTTYLNKKYDVPFAPFAGVNCYEQSILLRCGLVSRKDVQIFVWLFESRSHVYWDVFQMP